MYSFPKNTYMSNVQIAQNLSIGQEHTQNSYHKNHNNNKRKYDGSQG